MEEVLKRGLLRWKKLIFLSILVASIPFIIFYSQGGQINSENIAALAKIAQILSMPFGAVLSKYYITSLSLSQSFTTMEGFFVFISVFINAYIVLFFLSLLLPKED